MKTLLSIGIALATIFCLNHVCAQEQKSNKKSSQKVAAPISINAAAPLPTVLKKIDTVVGSGDEATVGKKVSVHYSGWLFDRKAENQRGKAFDSSIGRTPFGFEIGKGQVISGWEQGVSGMKVGGKRTLIIPSILAYGPNGAGNGLIPPLADLIFDIELLDVSKTTTHYYTWTDSRTGLTWTEESLGKKTWWQAAVYVSQLDRDGFQDWRLPTITELESVFNSKLYEKVGREMIWSDEDTSALGMSAIRGYGTYRFNIASDNKIDTFAVRGGDQSLYANFSQRVKERHKALNDAAIKEQNEKRQAQLDAEAYERRVVAFRKSVSEGDDTTKGVVVQVKGDLVKVQTSESQCSQRNYQGECTNYINTSAEKWFKRSEIYPIR
jgi:FKBP-type peptidyl-prolyl cis-trans isomerase FkpA